MDIFIMLAIVIANIIAVLLIYQFIKKLPKMERIIFIAVSFATMYILVSIAYWISGFGIDDKINEVAKDFITYVFVPVNVILLVPFVAAKYNKFRLKEIEKNEFVKRLVIIGILGIIVITIECFYFKDMKNNIKLLNDNMVENNKQTNSVDEELEITNTLENEIDTNGIDTNIKNVEIVNETTNTVFVNDISNTKINVDYLE